MSLSVNQDRVWSTLEEENVEEENVEKEVAVLVEPCSVQWIVERD